MPRTTKPKVEVEAEPSTEPTQATPTVVRWLYQDGVGQRTFWSSRNPESIDAEWILPLAYGWDDGMISWSEERSA